MTVKDVVHQLGQLDPLDGVTVSGGEPFDQPESLYALLKGFRAITQESTTDVLVFSGYRYERLSSRFPHILELIDTLVAGPFMQGQPGDSSRGSGNQVVVNRTEMGRARYEAWLSGGKRAQVTVSGGALWMIGIPEDSDLQRLEAGLLARGVTLTDVSWRC